MRVMHVSCAGFSTLKPYVNSRSDTPSHHFPPPRPDCRTSGLSIRTVLRSGSKSLLYKTTVLQYTTKGNVQADDDDGNRHPAALLSQPAAPRGSISNFCCVWVRGTGIRIKLKFHQTIGTR